MKIASLVKIMTAVVALEHKNMDDKLLFQKATGVGENTMRISGGEFIHWKNFVRIDVEFRNDYLCDCRRRSG